MLTTYKTRSLRRLLRPVRKAFTLIELLVVISIIALLLSILMPSLRKIKEQARAVICRSNLKQWSTIWNLYLTDHQNRFPSGLTGVWVEPLRPYYEQGGEKMRVCPTATKNDVEGGSGWFIAWDMINDPSITPPEVYRGSYGVNNWLYDCPEDFLWGHDTTYHWRRGDVKGANNIPIFLDCWRWGGHPYNTDAPYPDPPEGRADYLHGMNRFCLDRHNGYVNSAFLDFSVRRVGLKQMWKLKWSTNFDTSGYSGTWPEWMAGLPD